MPAERNCALSVKVAVDPIERCHSPFIRGLLSDPDYPQRQTNVLPIARLDRIFHSGTIVRCSATVNGCW